MWDGLSCFEFLLLTNRGYSRHWVKVMNSELP